MDKSKIFDDLGGKGKIEKISLPVVEETEAPVPVFVDDTEETEE